MLARDVPYTSVEEMIAFAPQRRAYPCRWNFPVHDCPMKLLEREPGARYLADAADVERLIEDCISAGSRAALLHAENLPHKFFDLSSGQAGQILQKLRTYRVRLAVVAPSERVATSPRFGDMVAGERRSGQFAMFETREAAAAWLVTGEHEVVGG
jgi:hypothetical protein